jgi:1-acyl-sn-glycerol-3-phosphate acyltransferase
MRIIKSFFLALWSVWCLLVLVFMMSITWLRLVYYFYIFPSKKRLYKAHFISGWVSKWNLRLWGVRCVINGPMPADDSQHYVVVVNHCSDLDPFICSAIFKNLYIKYLGKAEILKYPVFGLALRKMYIAVQRNNRSSREQVMQLMIDTINNSKCSLFIYPEGTRNKGPQLLTDFHDGAFRVAIATQTPILVATLVNSFTIMKPRSWVLHPQTLYVEVAPAIATQGLSNSDVPALKQKTKDIMLAAFAKHGVQELV